MSSDSVYSCSDADGAIRTRIAEAVQAVKDTTPLAQSFTNFVTINLVANAQLASGGTAAMSFLPDDIIDTAKIAGANYINVGTLLPFYKDALPDIAQRLAYLKKPWVLDPVAAGIGKTRTAILKSFRDYPPTIVRGNASEIIALADMWGLPRNSTDFTNLGDVHGKVGGHNATSLPQPHAASDTSDNIPTSDASAGTTTRPAGVESVDDVDAAIPSAIALAKHLSSHMPAAMAQRFSSENDAASVPCPRAAVAVSGAVDLVTDGETVYRLPGGSAMMAKITGAGCSLGGVTAVYLAVADPLIAALAASLLYDRAAEIAEHESHGPGSFQVAFLDALWNVTAEQVASSPLLVAS
ncbi:hydroxyethylthiazole kinase [Bifidobacterium oedipodis]|uniref:Hydroxyethylthiazole kinase n=1 Tax=Bifidobacterium oedipodis TaxID=2675322 RepID=A0A7Y0EPK4_9BIFI|nr:hydroxyethylthiazole kinase [Bifidobacterium sp. DSM 109957]NMM93997.1 hydroxyethylthiazole kinase [Bifidobacterium sp. DSM 109957]